MKSNLRNKKITFNQILRQNEDKNGIVLMHKARQANRLAKTLHGHKKQLAYSVKHKALRGIIKNISSKALIQKDDLLNDFVVVKFDNLTSGLHFPVILLH